MPIPTRRRAGDTPPAPGGKRSLLNRLLEARNKQRSPWLLVVAVALFLVFTLVAVRNLPPIDQPVRWSLVLLAGLVCVPFAIVLNALEYRLMAHLAEHHPPRLEILQVTIMGTAANLLPIPGAVVVRLANLNKGGVKMGRGLNLTAIVGITWVGAACALGGTAELFSHPGFGISALAVGIALLGIAMAMLMRIVEKGERARGAIELIAIEVAFVLTQAFRLFLVAAALRFDVSFAQASTLVIAAVTAAAIGFLPAGLGAREAIAAILSPIVGFPAAVGLVITAVDRVINLVILSVFGALVTFATRHDRTCGGCGSVEEQSGAERRPGQSRDQPGDGGPELGAAIRASRRGSRCRGGGRACRARGGRGRRCRRTAGRRGRRTARRGRPLRARRPSSRRGGSADRAAARPGTCASCTRTSAPSASSCSAIVIAGDSRQSLVPGLYASAEQQDPRAVDRALLRVQHRDDAADDVLGHAAVDVVGELDEAEAVRRAAARRATRGTTGRSAGSGRRRRARA